MFIQNSLSVPTAYTCRVLEFAKLIDDVHLQVLLLLFMYTWHTYFLQPNLSQAKCWSLLRERTEESLVYFGF